MLAIKVYKQKNIGTAIPVSIGCCSQDTSGIISDFHFFNDGFTVVIFLYFFDILLLNNTILYSIIFS